MNDQAPAVSLVMATVGRTDPIAVFLDALDQQHVNGVELLVVDQNDDERVDRLLARRASAATIRHLRSRRGLSLARNIGVQAAQGEIIGFPDDDCWYPPGHLKKLLAWFAAHQEADGLSCRVVDAEGRHSAGGYMATSSHWIDRKNVWRSLTSPGLFVRRRMHTAAGGFDERLGLGSGTPWGSAEETDYVLRVCASGSKIYYDPSLIVFHPRRTAKLRREDLSRAWSYGLGAGFVLCKNGYGPARALYYSCLPLASGAMSVVQGEPGNAVAKCLMGCGRLAGWCRAPRAMVRSSSPTGESADEGLLRRDAARVTTE